MRNANAALEQAGLAVNNDRELRTRVEAAQQLQETVFAIEWEIGNLTEQIDDLQQELQELKDERTQTMSELVDESVLPTRVGNDVLVYENDDFGWLCPACALAGDSRISLPLVFDMEADKDAECDSCGELLTDAIEGYEADVLARERY